MALFHHDPERTDEQVEAMVRGLQRSGEPDEGKCPDAAWDSRLVAFVDFLEGEAEK